MTDYNLLCRNLTATAWRAGRAIMAHFGTAVAETKADDSPVTAADRAADSLIAAELAELAPEIPAITEESVSQPVADPGPKFFLVDPLDGTKEFVQKRGEFTVNIALVVDATPVFGLVYAPAIGDIYLTLARDKAARSRLAVDQELPTYESLPWQVLHTRPRPKGGLVAAVSRSHLDDATRAFLDDHKITETITGGSSLKFGLVAEGRADVYPRFGRTMEWDTAAGHALLGAAGGHVVDETGRPLTYGKADRGLDNPGFIAWGSER